MRTLSGVTALACGALLTLAVPTAASAATDPTCFGQAATIVGTPGDDSLTGTTGPDVIVGLSGNDTISGLEGDDRLCGGKGADALTGGDGDDHLAGGRDLVKDVTDDGDLISFGDDLDGGAGNDELDPGWDPGNHEFDGWVGDVIRFPGSTVGPHVGLHIDLGAGTAVGQGDDTLDLADVDSSVKVLGSPQNDVIRGSSHADWIDAGDGDDKVLLRGGSDYVNEDGPDSGDDTYRGGRGADVLESRSGDDVVDGGAGNDTLSATQHGTDRIVTVLGGDGDDDIAFFDTGTDPHDGSYTYRGGRGNDWFVPQVEDRPSVPMLADLATHAVDVGDDVADFGGFEHLDLLSRHGAVHVTGTPSPDKVSITAQNVTAHLGDGADDLLVTDSGKADVRLGDGADRLRMSSIRHGAVARLGAGDDLVASAMYERLGLETLYGGAGRDTARLIGRHFVWHGIENVTFPS